MERQFRQRPGGRQQRSIEFMCPCQIEGGMPYRAGCDTPRRSCRPSLPYAQPDVNDFPGLREFVRRLLFMSWSHNVKPRHVAEIAAAVRKVATLLPEKAPGRQPSQKAATSLV